MQKHSLASPGFSGSVSAAGLTGHVTGNLYTQLLITDKWVDMLSLPAPGASCQSSFASPPEEPMARLGLPELPGVPWQQGQGGHWGWWASGGVNRDLAAAEIQPWHHRLSAAWSWV